MSRLENVNLRALFSAVLLGTIHSCNSGCYCPPPASHIQWVAMPPSGDGAAAFAIDCEHACGSTVGCVRAVKPDGTPGIECGIEEGYRQCGMGRRPMGLCPPRRDRRAAASPLRRRASEARMLAEFAMLEGASVGAFRALGANLERLGAPAELADRARGAAVEEARHARTMTGLARRAGARSRPIRVTDPAPPTLLELAIDNAVEGCVLETFGALLTTHQARVASDRRFREAIAIIAEEETSHAALARDVDAWVRTRLSEAEVAALDAAHQNAWRALGKPRRARASRRLGLPDGKERARLARALGYMLVG